MEEGGLRRFSATFREATSASEGSGGAGAAAGLVASQACRGDGLP